VEKPLPAKHPVTIQDGGIEAIYIAFRNSEITPALQAILKITLHHYRQLKKLIRVLKKRCKCDYLIIYVNNYHKLLLGYKWHQDMLS